MIWMQCKAESLRIIRNPYYLFWSLFMPVLFYFIYTNVFKVNDTTVWKAHFLMSMATFSVMGSSIMTMGIRLVQERAEGWAKFMRITPLPYSIYFFSKIVGQSVVHILSIVVIFAAGILINGVTMSAGQWVMSGIWILLGSLPFLGLGALVGTMKRVDTASGVSNVIYLALAFMGGMWMPMDVLPKVFQSISHGLPSYYYGSGAWEIIRGESPSLLSIMILLGYLFLFTVLSGYIRRKQEAI
ncbi:ABC transporter permease [Peribacillus sp. JNUCC 23]|uniref:ABC transporter permease n=1 Tax=Peribacillus sp. NPDC096379 TaxID=3364393 RepID=UPI00380695DD